MFLPEPKSRVTFFAWISPFIRGILNRPLMLVLGVSIAWILFYEYRSGEWTFNRSTILRRLLIFCLCLIILGLFDFWLNRLTIKPKYGKAALKKTNLFFMRVSGFVLMCTVSLLMIQIRLNTNDQRLNVLKTENTWIAMVAEPSGRWWQDQFNVTLEALNRHQMVVHIPRRGKCLLRVKASEQYSPGTWLLLRGKIKSLDVSRNPGGFSTRSWGLGRGILAQLEAVDVLPIQPSISFWKKQYAHGLRLIYQLRRALLKRLVSVRDTTTGRYSAALLLSQTKLLDEAETSAFYRAGLGHLLAVSGTHVGVLIDIFSLLLLHLPLFKRKWLLRFLPMGICILCLFCIGPTPALLRVSIQRIIGIHAKWTKRNYDNLNCLTGAALCTIYLRPHVIFSLGFQLSYASAFAIQLSNQWLMRRFKQEQNPTNSSISATKILKFWKHLQSALLISTSCFCVTIPWNLVLQGGVNPVSILGNLIAVPVSALCLSLIIVGLIVAHLPYLGFCFLWGIRIGIWLLRQIASLSGWGFMSFNIWMQWFCPILCGLILIYWIWRKSHINLFVSLMLIVSYWLSGLVFCQTCTLYFLDVGQGDALFIRTPGLHLLIDTGTKAQFKRVLLPAFQALNISQLDVLILTHLDEDHVGGAAQLIQAGYVKCLIAPPFSLIRAVRPDLAKAIIEQQIEHRSWVSGSQSIFKQQRQAVGKIDIYHPSSWSDGRNGDSLMGVLQFGTFRLMTTGDISNQEEAAVLFDSHLSKVSGLKVAHHGSKQSSSLDFLEAIQPQWGVVSCGRNNHYGHPAPETIARFKKVHCDLYRTDESGCIVVEIPRLIWGLNSNRKHKVGAWGKWQQANWYNN